MPLEPQAADVLEDVGGVLAAEDRVEEDPVHLTVDPPRRLDVAGVGRVHGVGHGVEGEPEPQGGVALAQGGDGLAVAEHEVMRRGEPVGGRLPAGRVLTTRVADERRAPRLVERRPRRDPVPQPVMHRECVVHEAVGRLTNRPATAILQRWGRSQW